MWLLHVLLKILTWKDKAEKGLTLLTMTRSFPSTPCLFLPNELWWGRCSDKELLLQQQQLSVMLRCEAGPCLLHTHWLVGGGTEPGQLFAGGTETPGQAPVCQQTNNESALPGNASRERNWSLLTGVQTIWQNWKWWEKFRILGSRWKLKMVSF